MPDPTPDPAAPETVVLTRAQLDTLQRGQLLLQKLAQGKTKRNFENLVKEIVPEIETTDDQIAEYAKPYVDKLTATEDKLSKFLEAQETKENASADAQAAAKLSSDFAAMRAEGLTEEGESKVRELMIARNIPDPWAALALWERNNPKPAEAVSAYIPDAWNLETNAVGRDNEKLFTDTELWTGEEVGNILAEMRRPQQV